MPRRAQVAEPEPEAEEDEDEVLDYTVYAGKDATPTMEHFGIWIIDQVFGGKVPKNTDEDSFLDGVRLGGTLRMEFQRSEYWHDMREQLKAEREEARTEARSTRSAKNGKAETEEDEDEEEAPPVKSARAARGRAPAAAAPAKATRGRAAAKAEVPATPAKRGRGRATAEAPF